MVDAFARFIFKIFLPNSKSTTKKSKLLKISVVLTLEVFSLSVGNFSISPLKNK